MIGSTKATIKFAPNTLDGVNNVILQVDYVGDMGSAYIDGRLVADNFYNGTVWEIGLKQAVPDLQELLLLITPMMEKAGGLRYVPTGMAFSVDADHRFGEIQNVRAIPEYRIPLSAR